MPATRTTRPAAWASRPARRRAAPDSAAVRLCAAAAAPKTTNTVSPASARDGWCSVPATKPGATEVNRPNTAKAANAPAAATR